MKKHKIEENKLRISSMHLYYNDFQDEYSLTVTIGDAKTAVTFKMNDEQTRKAIIPFIDAVCDACAVAAEDLKKKLLEDITGTDQVTNKLFGYASEGNKE